MRVFATPVEIPLHPTKPIIDLPCDPPADEGVLSSIRSLAAESFARYDEWSAAQDRKMKAEKAGDEEGLVRAELELRRLWAPMDNARMAYHRACDRFFAPERWK